VKANFASAAVRLRRWLEVIVSVLIAVTLVVLGFFVRDLVITSRNCTLAESAEINIAWVLCRHAIADAQDRLVWEIGALGMVALVWGMVVRGWRKDRETTR
jgi:hypothetical protein